MVRRVHLHMDLNEADADLIKAAAKLRWQLWKHVPDHRDQGEDLVSTPPHRLLAIVRTVFFQLEKPSHYDRTGL